MTDVVEAIGSRLRRWSQQPRCNARVAAIEATADGFIAALRRGATTQVVTGRCGRGGCRVSDAPKALLTMLECADGTERAVDPEAHQCARRALIAWGRRREADREVGPARGADNQLWRTARRRVDAALAAAPLAARAVLAAQLHEAFRSLAACPGAGTTQRLRQLVRTTRDPAAFASGLVACSPGAQHHRATHVPMESAPPRLVALLLLSPSRPAPPATSPRTAAPR
ncbi:MAG: hypothetical protein WD771_05960 [Gemmatimonadaceae bacterium]